MDSRVSDLFQYRTDVLEWTIPLALFSSVLLYAVYQRFRPSARIYTRTVLRKSIPCMDDQTFLGW